MPILQDQWDTLKSSDNHSPEELHWKADKWLFLCRSVFENAIDMAHIHYLHNDTFGNQVQLITWPEAVLSSIMLRLSWFCE